MIKSTLSVQKYADKTIRQLENVFGEAQLIESHILSNGSVVTLTRKKIKNAKGRNDYFWGMESNRTGSHGIYAERFVNERVLAHWEGFLENNNKLGKIKKCTANKGDYPCTIHGCSWCKDCALYK
jgi:hypothetical protein